MTIVYGAARVTELTTAKQLDNPLVAWNNLAALSTTVLGGTATLTDGAVANAVSGTTYDYWLPNVTGVNAQLTAKFPAPVAINCAYLAAHNLATLGASVVLSRSTDGGATWSATGLGGTVTPTDNSPIMFRVASSGIDAANWRLFFSGLTASAPLYVGVAFFGTDMVFPSRIYRGFEPALTPSEVQLQSNVSVGGNLLGNSIVAKGSTINASFNNLGASWVRSTLKPFAPHFNAGKGFAFAWRPTTYTDDVHYCWREGSTLRPINSGPLAYMSADLQMRAYES